MNRPKKCLFKTSQDIEVFIPVEGLIDIEAQIKRLNKDLDKTQKELEKLNKKLNNSKFIDNAPDDVIKEVKDKADIFTNKVKSIELNLQSFQ